ncbi:MAG: tetratricopeptide repeat protein [Gammaproteobacteria bacterium]
MTSARTLRAILCGCLLVVGSASADQTDPRLDELFGSLANAPNGHLAAQVEQEIWSIWFEGPVPAAGELLAQARRAGQSGDVETATELFDRLVETYPGYAEGWNQRAIVRYLRGDVNGSLADIERALELEPRHFGALSGRGQCYMQLERYREALLAFEDALSINPWIESVRTQVQMLRGYIGQQSSPSI